MSQDVSVSFCCMTNHPKALGLTTANIYLAHSSVGWHLGLNSSGWFWWLGRGFADLSWACSCVCGQLVGQLGPTGLWRPRLDDGMTGAFLHELTHPPAGQPRLTHVVVKGSKRVETARSLEAEGWNWQDQFTHPLRSEGGEIHCAS